MICHFAYLFDAEQYKQTVSPLNHAIESGNYQGLRRLAWEAIQQPDSNLEMFLRDVQLGDSVEDFRYEEERDHVHYWLMVVLGKFVKQTSSLSDYSLHSRLLQTALPLTGWSSNEAAALIVGESMCTLLAPYLVSEPVVRSHWPNNQRAPWCEFGPGEGWLSNLEVQRLYNKIGETRKTHPELHLHPRVQQEIARYPLRSDKLLIAFDEVSRMLSSAIESRRALFLVVA